MLDTVKFYTDDFVIRDDAEIELMPSVIDYKTGETDNKNLFQRSSGQWVKGSKAFLNTDRLNLTIKPIGDHQSVFLWVSLSVPKFLTGDNFYSLDDNEAKGLPSSLETELKNRGIGLDVNELKIGRLDAFKNVYASEAFEDYVPIFNILKAKRQNRRVYGSTFLWENTQREICVYDKLTEVKNRGYETLNYPKNTIRFEYRLLKSKSVNSALKFKTVKRLFSNLDSVGAVYNEALENHLFGLDVGEFEHLVGSQWEKVIRYYSQNEGRNWHSKMRMAFGDYGIAKSLGLDRYREMIENHSYGRVAGWRAEKAVREGYQKIELIAGEKGYKSHVDLYSELKNKVLE